MTIPKPLTISETRSQKAETDTLAAMLQKKEF